MKLFIHIILFFTFTLSAQEHPTLTEEEYKTIPTDIMKGYAKDPVKAAEHLEEYLTKYKRQLSKNQYLRIMYTKAYLQINAEKFTNAHTTLLFCKQLADE